MAHDHRLSRFDPLARVLFFDDFDDGLHGWMELIGNYEGSLDSMLPPYRDLRPPMLSSATMWDTGTHGSVDGVYSMKLATRPRAGHQAVAVKRFTWRELGTVRLEAYVACKPEASELQLGDLDVQAFGLLFDLQNAEARFMPHLRYLNALDGRPRRVWQYRTSTPPRQQIGTSGQTGSTYHLSPEGWLDLPGGEQGLCYNELPTKLNWHYLRLDADLRAGTYTAFRCNDRTYDLSELGLIRTPPEPTLPCLLNCAFFVEAGRDQRAFLYVDSVLVSTDV
ncbi:MAG: hypothetical protein HY332_15370 [Chloroflexi bacterium]|nr:hypothetical protein [Chloroflexota bacterium]